MKLLTDFLRPGKIFFRNNEYGPEAVIAGIDSVSRYLTDNLVSDSPFIYLFATNHIKTVFSYFGIIKARRICVIMDPKIGPLELEEMMQDTPPAACIRIEKSAISFDFSKEIELRNPPWKDGEDDLSDVCTMIYTAAEDGYAKAVMLTHENMLANARGISNVEKLNDKTISCGFTQYCHLFPLQGGVIAPLISKGSVYVEELSDLSQMTNIAGSIFNTGVTHLYSVPIVLYFLSKVKNIQGKIQNLSSIGSGGYKLSEEIFRQFYNKTQKEIHEGYGLSEAAPVCTWTNSIVKINAVGAYSPFCEVKIISKNGNLVLKGLPGEICVKGENVMKGYYKNIRATQKTSVEGWLHTGDFGFLDERILWKVRARRTLMRNKTRT